MATKIYTKTGDKGQTSLFGGKRVAKSNLRIEAYGTVDELNASVGYLSELQDNQRINEVLYKVQNKLFNIGSKLAVDPAKDFEMPLINEKDVTLLESEIDKMDSEMPPLKSFILPSGHPHGAFAHIVRTVCRRAERRVVALSIESEVDPLIIAYLNRLSDYFFTLARYIVQSAGGSERKWDPDV
jgi:cob(I)alamin adenosyltransferase